MAQTLRCQEIISLFAGTCCIMYTTVISSNVNALLSLFQDLPVLQEQSHESGMLPQSTTMADQSVPLPTHNLLFMNGVLSAWDGRWGRHAGRGERGAQLDKPMGRGSDLSNLTMRCRSNRFWLSLYIDYLICNLYFGELSEIIVYSVMWRREITLSWWSPGRSGVGQCVR